MLVRPAIIITAAAIVALAGCARRLPEPVTVSKERSVRAMVEAVDSGAGTARLRSEKGGQITLKAAPRSSGFARLRPGDAVHVKLLQAVAIELTPKSDLESRSSVSADSVARARLGGLPDSADISTVRVETVVVGIDRNAGLVLLRRADGELAVVSMGERADDLDKLQPGDMLSIEYNQAVLVELPR